MYGKPIDRNDLVRRMTQDVTLENRMTISGSYHDTLADERRRENAAARGRRTWMTLENAKRYVDEKLGEGMWYLQYGAPEVSTYRDEMTGYVLISTGISATLVSKVMGPIQKARGEGQKESESETDRVGSPYNDSLRIAMDNAAVACMNAYRDKMEV